MEGSFYKCYFLWIIIKSESKKQSNTVVLTPFPCKRNLYHSFLRGEGLLSNPLTFFLFEIEIFLGQFWKALKKLGRFSEKPDYLESTFTPPVKIAVKSQMSCWTQCAISVVG